MLAGSLSLSLSLGLTGCLPLGDAGDLILEEDAAELARYSVRFLIRDEPGVVYASAVFFLDDECPVRLEDAEVLANGTRLPGEISATACGAFHYGEAVKRSSNGLYRFQVRFRGSRLTETLAIEPVHFLAPVPDQEISAGEPFNVSWDRPIEGAEVVASNNGPSCVTTLYASEVDSISAAFPYLNVVGSDPCPAEIALRWGESAAVGEPFRGGEIGHRTETRTSIRVVR